MNKGLKFLIQRRKEKGRCSRCGRKLPPYYIWKECPICREKGMIRYKNRYANLKEQGLCTTCGKNKTFKNYSLCKKCYEAKKITNQKWYLKYGKLNQEIRRARKYEKDIILDNKIQNWIQSRR